MIPSKLPYEFGFLLSNFFSSFLQAKILYKALPFSKDERETIKMMIQGNVYGYLGILLEGRERFEEESLTRSPAEQPINRLGIIFLLSSVRSCLLYTSDAADE